MDENVLMLQSVTEEQLTYDQAARLLQLSNNDINVAVNKFFDQGIKALEEPDPAAWDNNVFHADRYGEQDTSGTIPSFNIEYAPGVDNYPHSGTASVAPSRPPSRTSHHSGTVGDTPMQSIENGQESGVMVDGKPVFGPANNDFHYDSNQWAMVPVAKAAEYIPDAAASQRKREEGGPAIIKPLPHESYLPALITILHSIPLFRNALLSPGITLTNYSVGDDWWKGGASTQARTIDHGSSREAAHELDIMHEAQRLMAFLDTTDRAYGSVGHLLQLDAFKEARMPAEHSDDELLKFLITWGAAYQNLMSKPLNGVLRSLVRATGSTLESYLLDATVVLNNIGTEKTLYDVLDDNLFGSAVGNAHIVDISNILVLRLSSATSDATRLGCKIPATFYADRYLEENKAVIDEMFQEMAQYETELKDLDARVGKLKYHTAKNARKGNQIETLKLLQSSMVAFRPKQDDLIEDPRNVTILSQLQSVYDNVERKLNVLEEQKKKAREMLNSIGSRFRAPFDDGSDSTTDTTNGDITTQEPQSQHPHTHQYKLCGVSTRPGVYYLQHPDIQSNVPSANQWWRIEYSTVGSDSYILRERLSLSSVLAKASTEHRSALLIYANEAATSAPSVPLSESLQQFVKEDNLRFLKELQDPTNGWGDYNAGSLEPLGGWPDKDPEPWVPIPLEESTSAGHGPDYADEWANYGGVSNFSAFGNQFQDLGKGKQDYGEGERGSGDSGMSSTTLTPNTEIEDEGVGMEMQEVNGGIAAWAGGMSSASSETVGGEVMDGVGDSQRTVNMSDVEMVDVDLTEDDGKEELSGNVEHIEDVRMVRKGG